MLRAFLVPKLGGADGYDVAVAENLISNPGVVDVNTVSRCIDDVITSGPKIDAGMARGNETLSIGQHPVALQRAPDRATVVAEFLDAPFSEALPVAADELEAKRHSL